MTYKKNPSKIVFAKITIEMIDFMGHYTHFTTDEREKYYFTLLNLNPLDLLQNSLIEANPLFLEKLREIPNQL